MKPDIWDTFAEYGSGFTLEAERLYDEKGEPLYYRLKMYGLAYPEGYEITGYNISRLLKRAIKDGKKRIRLLECYNILN